MTNQLAPAEVEPFSFFSYDVVAAIRVQREWPEEPSRALRDFCLQGELLKAEALFKRMLVLGQKAETGSLLDLCQLAYERGLVDDAKGYFCYSRLTIDRRGKSVTIFPMGYFPAFLALEPHLRELRKPFTLKISISRWSSRNASGVLYRDLVKMLIETHFTRLQVALDADEPRKLQVSVRQIALE